MWKSLKIPAEELRSSLVLFSGQSFRWVKLPSGAFAGPIGSRVYVIKELPDDTAYQALPSDASDDGEATLRDYLQLGVKVQPLFKQWKAADKNFARVSERFVGLRVLRQEPFENLISFICSSNNNIARITQMIGRLCARFGNKITEVEGVPLFTFPRPEVLAAAQEDDLRQMMFGYRAEYGSGNSASRCRARI
eukprot:EC724047.1.p1 GENE.EC724047.1~~EC724047.1.p1  ORF type:complete len:193 (+),score=12.68 EC724047.1:44-622(+)